MPRENVERSDARPVQLVAHELERTHRLRAIHDDFALVVDDAAAERAKILHEARDQTFVARALPDDPVSRATATSHRRPRIGNHRLERLRLVRNEIGAAIEQPHISEPGQRVQLPGPGVGGDGGGKELGARRSVFIEREHPPGRRELGCPDDVQLKNGRVSHPGIEQLHIELMPLRRVIGRPLELDPDSRIELHESL